MKNFKKSITVLMLVSVLSMSTVPAFAATQSPKPGNGFGDKNHQHIGPGGQSDNPGDHVKVSVSFFVQAEGTAKAVVAALDNIFAHIHIG